MAAILEKFCDRTPGLDGGSDATAALERLVRACQGLPVAEIELLLARSRAMTASLEKMASLVLEHKIQRFSLL